MEASEERRNNLTMGPAKDWHREMLGPIIDGLPDFGVCFLDIDGRIVSVNDGVSRFLGYQEHELVGLNASVLFTPEDQAKGMLQDEMQNVAGGVENRRWAVRQDGGFVLVDGRLQGLYDPKGELVGYAKIMRDVTRQAQAEDAMRRSEQRYRMLFDAVDEGFCILEVLFNRAGSPTDFRFVETNPAFQELTGTSAERGHTSHLSRTTREFWVTAATRVLDGGDTVRFETRMPKLERWFSVRAWRLNDDATTQIAVIFTDVTERKESEARLHASAQRYRALFEFMPVAVYTCDASGLVQDYNERAVEMWGREPYRDGAIDRFCGALRMYYPDGREMPHSACPTARVLHGEVLTADDYEIRIERPDGTIRNVGLHPRAIRDDQDNIVGVINNMYDLTDKTRSEEMLRERNAVLELQLMERRDELGRCQERFERAFEVGPVAACITSLEEDRIVEVNLSFEGLTGYDYDEVIGRNAVDVGLWSSKQDQATLARGVEDGGGKAFGDLRLQMRTKSDTMRDILVSGEQITMNEQQVWLKRFIDITDRKRTEEELTKAIEEVMTNANWFSTSVVQRLADLRKPHTGQTEEVDLTRREQQVLEQMARGRSDAQIAEMLEISRLTVRNYVASIYSKIDVHSRAEAVIWARERGMTG